MISCSRPLFSSVLIAYEKLGCKRNSDLSASWSRMWKSLNFRDSNTVLLWVVYDYTFFFFSLKFSFCNFCDGRELHTLSQNFSNMLKGKSCRSIKLRLH